LIVKTHAPANNLKVNVLFDHGTSLHFISLPALLTFEATFQAKNNVRSTPVLTLVLHQSHNVHTTYVAMEKGMEHKGEQR